MDYHCHECGRDFKPVSPPSNPDRPYCSRTCAAKSTNRLFPKRADTPKGGCLQCGQGLSSLNGTRYCTSVCAAQHRQTLLVNAWLETGTANLSGSKAHYVKPHLLSEQERRCARCAMPDTWQGKELFFVLDHIDGNPLDKRRENLRLLCPNCDAQTTTFKGKNRGHGRYQRITRRQQGKSF